MSCRNITVRNLTVDLFGHRPRRLVDNLSFTVSGGEVLALVGESGAGKSMTSLAIMDLLPQGIRRTGGSVVVNDRRLSPENARDWRLVRNRQVSMILQNPMSAFDPVFRVEDHFHETLASHGMTSGRSESARKAAAALRETGFDDPESILAIYPFQMSGGMLQRVMIALALITEPDYLIADEATTDLDVASQAKVLRLLDERRRERHLGMLIITHDLGVAAYLADTVAVMRNGALVEQGPAGDFFRNPQTPYARELLNAHHNLYTERLDCVLRTNRSVLPAGKGKPCPC